jgi:hypothetical protein
MTAAPSFTSKRFRTEAETLVWDVLDNAPLIDAHNDTPHVIKYDATASTRRGPATRTFRGCAKEE